MDVLEFEELGDKQLKVGWRFSCILKLPWKPVLAAAGASRVQNAYVVVHEVTFPARYYR